MLMKSSFVVYVMDDVVSVVPELFKRMRMAGGQCAMRRRGSDALRSGDRELRTTHEVADAEAGEQADDSHRIHM